MHDDSRRPRPRTWLALGGLFAALAGIGAVVLGMAGCAVAAPLRRGPSWPAEGAPPETVVVAVTEAVLDRSERAAFDRQTSLLYGLLPSRDGCVAYSRRKVLFGDSAWTLTVWRDEAAHDAFVGSFEHRRAMREGLSALKSAKFLVYEWPWDGPRPNWSDALERLRAVESIPYGASDARGQPPDARIGG